MLHLVDISPQALLAVTVSQTFFVFDDPDNLSSTGQLFCRTSLSWDLSDVFPHD